MTEYDFKLSFTLPAGLGDPDDVVERLGDGGCDDALVGLGLPGRVALDFTRQSASAQKAIISALADVKRAIPGAKLIEASPDLVGLTEAADFMGMSRQNMRKLWIAHSATFPLPIHEGNPALWHLAFVLEWLEARGGYQVERKLLDVAHAAMQINLLKESDHLDPGLPRKVRALVA